jgi:hypothetical protein
MDLCLNGIDPDFSGPRTCEPQYQSVNSMSCEVGLMCTQEADLGGGVSAVSSDSESAYCQEAGGASACNCYNSSGNFSFELPDADAQMSTCTDALEICSLVADATPTGPIECVPSQQFANGSGCFAQITCTQYAEVSDISVGIQGRIDMSCDELSDGVYTCNCQTGGGSDSYEVEATSAWNACSDAIVSCPELVDVAIGGGGGYFPPFYSTSTEADAGP